MLFQRGRAPVVRGGGPAAGRGDRRRCRQQRVERSLGAARRRDPRRAHDQPVCPVGDPVGPGRALRPSAVAGPDSAELVNVRDQLTIDRDVVEAQHRVLHGAGLVDGEVTVDQAEVVDAGSAIATQYQGVPGPLDRDVAKLDVAYHRSQRADVTLAAVEVALDDFFRDVADRHIAKVDVLDVPTADRVRLEVQREVRTVDAAVADVHVADAAGQVRAECDRAVLHPQHAVLDQHVLGRDVDAKTVRLAAGLERDAVVAGVDHAAADQNGSARLEVDAIVVRALRIDHDVPDRHVAAQHRMDLPERRPNDGDPLDQDVRAVVRLDETRSEPVAGAADALGDRYAEEALLPQRREVPVTLVEPTPPGVPRALAVERAGAGDRDVGAAVRVDHRRVVTDLETFVPGLDDGQVVGRIGAEEQGRTFGDVELDPRPEMDRAGVPGAGRYDDTAASGLAAGRDRPSDPRPGVVLNRSVQGDRKVARRKGRGPDVAQDPIYVRPPHVVGSCHSSWDGSVISRPLTWKLRNVRSVSWIELAASMPA